jgi:hypothetical protein
MFAFNNALKIGELWSDIDKLFDFVNHDVLLWQINIYINQCEAEWWFKSYHNPLKHLYEVGCAVFRLPSYQGLL